MDRDGRRFDVVLWGATGFTGQLVAEYLARHHGVGPPLRWALGGRSPDKLQRVRRELAAVDPAAASLELLLGDSADRTSLEAVARDARVVCSTVGPYTVHGRELVAACVEAGTDYCDLTGEPQFVRAMIDLHHARAARTGARIVHCCGYDSIPSDLGTLVLQEHARAMGSRCVQVKYFAGESKGGMSGGTAASMIALVEEARRDPHVRRLLFDPYALDPDRAGRGPDGHDQMGVGWDRDLRQFTGPFLMAAINTRVVRRSNALLGYAWGKDFRYSEAMSFGAGPRGLLLATAVSGAIVAGLGAVAIPAVRRFAAERILPASGEGPSRQTRERGYFVSRLVGTLEDGRKLFATVRGQSDPGYGETAKMLGESAMCLALDRDTTRREGGVLTPASAMGMTLVERLRGAGMTFEVGPSE